MTQMSRMVNAEWIKLRSLRSTWWTLGVMVVATVGLGALLCAGDAHAYSGFSAADKATWDPTNESLVGTLFGQLAIGVFGVLAITGEFASGTIRSSVAAAPRRTPLLAAKAVVYGGAALVVGEIISFASFFLGQAVIKGHAPYASFGQPGVARAVAMAGAYVALVCLISLGVGALLRHTAGAITAVVGVLLLIPAIMAALPSSFQNHVNRFLPEQIGGSSMAAVVKVPHAFSPLAGFGMLSLYAAVVLGLAGWSLVRRDV